MGLKPLPVYHLSYLAGQNTIHNIIKVVPALKNNLLYLMYVDDCFVLVRSKKIMDKLFNILNNAHDSINFTIEKENNGELAFLDVQIKRKENRFLTYGVQKKNFYRMLFINHKRKLKKKLNYLA